MKLTDNNKTIDITMHTWNGSDWGLDWSVDFFSIPHAYSEELDAYVVDDVDYCIEQAKDWENNEGDFSDLEDDPDDKCVCIEVLSEQNGNR